METQVLYYITGLLTASGIIIIWNFSTISIHFLSWMYKDRKIITVEDLGDAIAEKHPNIAELLYCPLCLGFWVSMALASAFWYLNDLSPWFIPICGFSWPLFIFLFYKHLDKQ